jgi:hypothetical protein
MNGVPVIAGLFSRPTTWRSLPDAAKRREYNRVRVLSPMTIAAMTQPTW